MNLKDVEKSIRTVADFPKKGIQFKDITTALKEKETLHFLADELYEIYKDKGITKVVGIESRGFILGSILAYKLNAGMVLMRKPGKLPADTFKIDYELEYGSNTLEIHKDALSSDDVVLLHDDLLATGGSAKAAIELIEIFKPEKLYADFLIELEFLNGREKLTDYDNINSLLKL